MRLVVAVLALGLVLPSCAGDEEARVREEAAKSARREAEKAERERQRAEVAAAVKASLAALGAKPDPDAVEKVCEPGLVGNALRLEPQVAEACSRAYVKLAQRHIRRRDAEGASRYLDRQRRTGVRNPEVSTAEERLDSLLEKKRTKQRAAAPAEAERAGGRANPSDWRQAQEFIAGLPAACSGSSASVESDGTVVIHLLCIGGEESMGGSVRIKDGIVTEVR